MDYKEFLEFAGIISEKDYKEVLNTLPNIEYDEDDLECPFYLNSKEEIAESFFRAMIYNNWNWCYLDSLDLETKTICICDVKSLEDLEDIKNKISPWVISNYEDLKSDLLEDLEVDKKKASLISKLCKLISIEELESLVKKYEKKGNSE